MKNQCDGCQAGHPLDKYGHHSVRTASGYNNGMVCQAKKYGCKPFEGVPFRTLCDAVDDLDSRWYNDWIERDGSGDEIRQFLRGV